MNSQSSHSVIPAKAGIHLSPFPTWKGDGFPIKLGMTEKGLGMTEVEEEMTEGRLGMTNGEVYELMFYNLKFII